MTKYCTETTPLNPLTDYGRQKTEAESMVAKNNNEFVIFRFATAFGVSPRMRLDLLPNDFTYRAVNDRFVVLFESHFKRNYIHVRDVSRVFQHALNNYDKMKGQIYNVGLSDANVSKRELCEHIQKQRPDFVFIEAPVGKDPDQRNYIVSNQRLREAGFEARRSLEEGIKELLKGYRMMGRSPFKNI